MNKESTGIFKACFALVTISAMLILSADAIALDIHNITITVTEYRLGGVSDSDPYEFSCGVTGDGITAVTMTTPGGVDYDLEAWTTAQYNWGFSQDDLTAEELVTSFPTDDDYIFTFNGEAVSVTLYHNPTPPSDFANITYPVNNSTNVPLNPEFIWEDCSTYGEALTRAVGEEEGDMVSVVWLGDISETSWTVGPLNPGLLHWLELSIYTGTTPSDLIYGTDTYNYYDLFENCNEVLFTTVISAPDAILNLAQDVYALNLPKGTANSLLAKLHEAYQKLMDGNDKNDMAAINKLEAFINAVEAQRGKKIAEADADNLIALAQAIIDKLKAG